MPRLYRPHIPLSVRCEVALRQLEYTQEQIERRIFSEDSLAGGIGFGAFLKELLDRVAKAKGCEVSDLRLDHDPPLAARYRERRGLGKKTYYIPDANDPDFLKYRPHGPQFDGSHLIKTNVRGDHGQHPDRVLIKKARQAERGPKPKRGPKIKSHGFKKLTTKQKWPSRPFSR